MTNYYISSNSCNRTTTVTATTPPTMAAVLSDCAAMVVVLSDVVAVLPIAKIQLYSQSLPMLQAQTHGYVLFIVTEGVTFNKQRYFKLSSEFFDGQSSLLSVLQAIYMHIPVETIMHVTFDPGTCAHLASHAATC